MSEPGTVAVEDASLALIVPESCVNKGNGIQEDDVCASRGLEDVLIQGELSLMVGRSKQFQLQFLRVTKAYITYHSKPGYPAIDRINFEDVDSLIYYEENSLKIFSRPDSNFTTDEAQTISQTKSMEPLTDFIVCTAQSGYFRGILLWGWGLVT
jgi:hypothetical protein